VAANLADTPELVTPGDLGDELASFIRAMRANNVSPNTILAYGGAVRQFGRWLLDRGYTTSVSAIEPRHVEEWIGSILETSKPATAHNRWRGLQRFMNWYGGVDDSFVSPMRKLHPPRLPKLMPRVLELDELRAILATCQGGSFEDRRDNALIRVLFDTGARRHEIAALRYSPDDPEDRDVDVRRATVRVLGKGGKDNRIAVGDKTLSALDDYLRARRKHTHAALPWLWLGKRGQLTDSGVAQAIRDRGRRVGLPNLHAHDFRHAATHHELVGGMNEADVMSKRGWDSPAMLRRYASTTANERAIAASRKLGLGDKL
jgi:site-specific recombinase XerD